MSTASDPITEWKRAHQVLGVPLFASPRSIKQSYKQMVRRWHPDLYQDGTSAHAEATQMTKVINESYSLIKNAPLRYHADAFPIRPQHERREEASPRSSLTSNSGDTYGRVDRLEFAVRFVSGSLLGGLISLRLFFYLYDQPRILILSAAATIMLFGFLAARYGDEFWHSFFRHWWIWW